jgi:hypothetical protein
MFSNIKPGNQLSLNFGPPSSDLIRQVMKWLEDAVFTKTVTIQSMIDQLPGSALNLHRSLLIRILAVLVSEGKIFLLAHGESMSISAARYVLETPDRWKTIGIRLRRRLPLERIQKICRILSPHMELPAPDDQDNLSDAIRLKLGHWRIEFQEFSRLCDRNGYPGQSDIQECLKMIHELGRIPGADEILCEIQNDRTIILLDRIKQMQTFFGVQIIFWNATQKTMARVPPNLEELAQVEWFEPDWSELVLLTSRPDPWNVMDRIRELNARIAGEIDRIERARIAGSKQKGIQQIDGMVQELSGLFQEKNMDPELRHRTLFSLQQIKKKLLNASTPSDVDHLLTQAEDEYVMAL